MTSEMKQNIIAGIKTVISVAFLLLFLGSGIGSEKCIPDNAIVYADDSKMIYYSVPEKESNNIENVRKTTIQEVHDLKYSSDESSKEHGDFISEGRSLTGIIMEKVGILSTIPPRWNDDGTWNY